MDLKLLLLLLATLKTFTLASEANTGELQLKGEQLKYIGREPINSKNASSVMECHLFCLEHKSKCKSMNVEEVALGTLHPYRCESFDVRNTPAVKPESFLARLIENFR